MTETQTEEPRFDHAQIVVRFVVDGQVQSRDKHITRAEVITSALEAYTQQYDDAADTDMGAGMPTPEEFAENYNAPDFEAVVFQQATRLTTEPLVVKGKRPGSYNVVPAHRIHTVEVNTQVPSTGSGIVIA
jgi:hypothetical protein